MRLQLLILLVFLSFRCSSQNEIRIYKVEGKTHEINKKFAVQEYTLRSDSTYTFRNYRLDNKFQREGYRYYKPITDEGKYRKEGDFYILKSFNQDFDLGRFMVTDDNMIYYYEGKKSKLKKGAKYKRLQPENLPKVEIIKQIKEYAYYRSIDKKLTESITEGKISYGPKFEDIGGYSCFKFVYGEEGKNELVRVKYTQSTDEIWTENYYYKFGDLIHAVVIKENPDGKDEKKEIFLSNGHIIWESKTNFLSAKILIEKGNSFLAEYKASR
ncbi:hypothetical protein FGF1_08940 [Flavobacteriaceae bacterium GF1]